MESVALLVLAVGRLADAIVRHNLLHLRGVERPKGCGALVCTELEEFLALFVISYRRLRQTTFLAHATAIQERSGSVNPAAIGNYKIGKPYQINGVWYYPKID